MSKLTASDITAANIIFIQAEQYPDQIFACKRNWFKLLAPCQYRSADGYQADCPFEAEGLDCECERDLVYNYQGTKPATIIIGDSNYEEIDSESELGEQLIIDLRKLYRDWPEPVKIEVGRRFYNIAGSEFVFISSDWDDSWELWTIERVE